MENLYQSLQKVLNLIPSKIRNKLTLVGSYNLYIQGVNVLPKKDIDLATDFETVQYLRQTLGKYVHRYCDKPDGDEFLPFSYLFVEVDGVAIELFDACTYGKSFYKGLVVSSNTKNFENISISVLNLKTELQVYKHKGKLDKVKIIEDFILA